MSLWIAEHLCCLAYARAKFKYAYELGCENARFFLEKMGRLHNLGKENLTPENFQSRRNDAETTSIIESMRYEMFDLLSQSKETLSDLMNKALNYLHTFWKQLFA